MYPSSRHPGPRETAPRVSTSTSILSTQHRTPSPQHPSPLPPIPPHRLIAHHPPSSAQSRSIAPYTFIVRPPGVTTTMLPRRLLKLLLGLLIGFWLGLILGCISSMLMWILLPEQWLANGLADRRARAEEVMKGRECKVRLRVHLPSPSIVVFRQLVRTRKGRGNGSMKRLRLMDA